MDIPAEIDRICKDRVSGSVTLLNRLIPALEQELRQEGFALEHFLALIAEIRGELGHFAAIENFLAALLVHAEGLDGDPGNALHFMKEYKAYWQDSAAKVATNLLSDFNPEGTTLLIHSQSQTILSLLEELQKRQVSFQVMQTLSVPGEEGRIAYEKFLRMGIGAELIEDAHVGELIHKSGLVLLGCDALLPDEFLNKTGSKNMLEMARTAEIPSVVVTESRKRIARPGWKTEQTTHPLFEWVPLELVDRIVTERI